MRHGGTRAPTPRVCSASKVCCCVGIDNGKGGEEDRKDAKRKILRGVLDDTSLMGHYIRMMCQDDLCNEAFAFSFFNLCRPMYGVVHRPCTFPLKDPGYGDTS
jgi:hypothetical protein